MPVAFPYQKLCQEVVEDRVVGAWEPQTNTPPIPMTEDLHVALAK